MAPRARRRSNNPAPALAPVPVPPPPGVAIRDALQFVLAVRRELAGEPGKYEEFLAILRDYGSVGVAVVVDRVKVVFTGHPDLLHGFDRFMPRGAVNSEPTRNQ